jgi:hypothetical protein
VLQITEQTVDIVTRHRNVLFLSGFSVVTFSLGIDNREWVATGITKYARLSETRSGSLDCAELAGGRKRTHRRGEESDRRVQKRWGEKRD